MPATKATIDINKWELHMLASIENKYRKKSKYPYKPTKCIY